MPKFFKDNGTYFCLEKPRIGLRFLHSSVGGGQCCNAGKHDTWKPTFSSDHKFGYFSIVDSLKLLLILFLKLFALLKLSYFLSF